MILPKYNYVIDGISIELTEVTANVLDIHSEKNQTEGPRKQ